MTTSCPGCRLGTSTFSMNRMRGGRPNVMLAADWEKTPRSFGAVCRHHRNNEDARAALGPRGSLVQPGGVLSVPVAAETALSIRARSGSFRCVLGVDIVGTEVW